MKISLSILILCLFSTFALSQNKLILGGTLSADLGRFNDHIDVMPSIAIRTLSRTYIGVGLTYAYYNQPNTAYFVDDNFNVIEYQTSYRIHYTGVNLFSRLYPWELDESGWHNFFVHAEFEYLKGNGTYKDDFVGSFDFETTNETVFGGVGYKYPLGTKLALQTSLLYRVNDQSETPYNRLVFRLGVEF